MASGKKTETNLLNPIAIDPSLSNIILRTENLGIGYSHKNRQVLIQKDIEIQLHTGQLTAIIGVNGVGKSTLLKTLSGVLAPLSGDIYINGKQRSALRSEELAKLISLVLTHQPISKNLNVKELVSLGRQPYTNWAGSLQNTDIAIINAALEKVQLEDLQDKKCFELSDGQLQKVMIARALAQDTPIMILDEPTTHLDVYHKAQVMQLLGTLSTNSSKAVLFATHEIDLAIQLCDQIIVMQDNVVLQGTPEELVQEKVFERLFPNDLVRFDSLTRGFQYIKRK